MKRLLLLTATLLVADLSFGQPQPQGEFHQHLFKKSHTERVQQGKSSEMIGVVVFSTQEIPRLGTIKEIEPILGTEFRRYQCVWARCFLPKHLGALPGGMPNRIVYRMIVDGKQHYEKELTGEYLPLPEWSSWMIQLPDALQEGYDTLPPEPVQLRLEVWASKSLTKDSSERLIATGECTLQP
jgi:hypothetical protein